MAESKSAGGMVTGVMKKAPKMDAKFSRIEIHPATNGFRVMHHAPIPERKAGADWMPPPEPTETVWGKDDGEAMQAHIAGIMGIGKGQKSGKMADKKPASGKETAPDKAGEGKNEPEGDADEDDE